MLQFSRTIQTIDAHTAGEPLRIIISGIPLLPGKSILEKRKYMLEHYDHLRKFLMLEPRGHSGMYGCIVTPPVTEDGDFGVLFMHNEGYSTMCGHGIIGITKVAVETGMIDVQGTERTIRIDSPAGRVTAYAHIQNGKVNHVSFDNVPSFVYAQALQVPVAGVGTVSVDIAFGGAFYAFVEAKDLGVKVVPEQMDLLVKLGMEIKYKVMEMRKIRHPLEPQLEGIYGTIITEPVKETEIGLDSKNVTIFADGQIDRSPTGTGTSARVALLYEKGLMKDGMPLINRSIIETVFTGRIKEFVKVDGFTGVVPEVGGTAQIMGYNQFVLEPEDPLPEGFLANLEVSISRRIRKLASPPSPRGLAAAEFSL